MRGHAPGHHEEMSETLALLALGASQNPTGGPEVVSILFQVGLTTRDSVTTIPSGARVTSVMLVIGTPYSAGTTIEIGSAGSPALLMATGDNDPQAANTYEADQLTSWPATDPVQATVSGAPAAGSATVFVEYVITPSP